jgi:hypothetical protein
MVPSVGNPVCRSGTITINITPERSGYQRGGRRLEEVVVAGGVGHLLEEVVAGVARGIGGEDEPEPGMVSSSSSSRNVEEEGSSKGKIKRR